MITMTKKLSILTMAVALLALVAPTQAQADGEGDS